MTTYNPQAGNKLTQRQNQVLQFITSFTGGNIFQAEVFFVKNQPIRNLTFGGQMMSMRDPELDLRRVLLELRVDLEEPVEGGADITRRLDPRDELRLRVDQEVFFLDTEREISSHSPPRRLAPVWRIGSGRQRMPDPSIQQARDAQMFLESRQKWRRAAYQRP
jgi:hypothetical protein